MFLETIKAKYPFVGIELQADALLVLVCVDKRIRLISILVLGNRAIPDSGSLTFNL